MDQNVRNYAKNHNIDRYFGSIGSKHTKTAKNIFPKAQRLGFF